MKKIIAMFISILFFTGLFSQSNKSNVFELSPVKDSILLGSSAAFAGSVFLTDNMLELGHDKFDGKFPSKDDVPYLDQVFMNKYNKNLDLGADVIRAFQLVAPVALFGFTTQKDRWLTIGTMYAETMFFAYGITDGLKLLVNRSRPYMYYEGYPEDELKNGKWNESFPSGHATICFASATFTSYVFSKYYPESKYKPLVIGTSYGLATGVAAMRLASGNHFLSDVCAGALIGTVCGFAIPYLHTVKPNLEKYNADVEVSPLGFTISKRF